MTTLHKGQSVVVCAEKHGMYNKGSSSATTQTCYQLLDADLEYDQHDKV